MLSDNYKNIKDVSVIEKDDLGIREQEKNQLPLLDHAEKNAFLQKKADEIQKQIDEIVKKMEEKKSVISKNSEKIDHIDQEDRPELEAQIEEKKQQLLDKRIDLNDHDNVFVKEYDILVSLNENKKTIIENYKDENKNLKGSIEEDDKVVKELEKQKELLVNLQKQNNKERVSEAIDDASKHSKSHIVTQSNAVLTFMEVIFQAADQRAQQKQVEKEIERKVNQQIAKEDFKIERELGNGRTDTDFEDEKSKAVAPAKADTKEAYIFIAHSDGKDTIRIMDAKQFQEYNNSGVDDHLVKSVKDEESLTAEEKKTSIVTLKHPDKEALLKELEPIVGKAVNFSNKLHEFVSTEEKRNKVIDTLFSTCKIDDHSGAGFFDKHIAEAEQKEKENEKHEEQSQMQTEAPAQQEQEDPKKSVKYGTQNQDAMWNLFDYMEMKYSLTKDKMRPEDIDKLQAGEPTGFYKLKGGQVGRLRPMVDPITCDLSVQLEIKRSRADYQGIQKTLHLSDTDIKNLKKFGVLDHPVKYNNKTGFIYKDEQTNNFLFTSSKDIRIDKKLKEQLDVETVKRLKEGKAVHVNNLKDDKGQSFSGWIMVDPKKRNVSPLMKEPAFYVDNEYQIQVKNNNDGARADVVKDDKDAVLKSKQQKNDDGPKPEESKTVYKDYSEDNSSTTEKTTTKSHKIK